MNQIVTYKYYTAHVEYDSKDYIYHGRIAEIIDIVTFHGESIEELRAAFREAVDDYLEACGKLEHEPHSVNSKTSILELKRYKGKVDLDINLNTLRDR